MALSAYPANSETINITVSNTANIVAMGTTANTFCVMNTSDRAAVCIAVYDTIAAAESAVAQQQHELQPGEQLQFQCSFDQQDRTVYAAASVTDTQSDATTQVLWTPVYSGE
jgi:hypothetical protein